MKLEMMDVNFIGRSEIVSDSGSEAMSTWV